MPIRFFNEDVNYSPRQKNQLKKWIAAVIKNENASPGEINYILCSDEYLLQINRDYLDHDYYTDIITFDQSEDEGIIEGDIYMSIDRIKENALNTNISFDEEFRRVLIHGVLHLIGYDDRSSNDKTVMRKKEEASLSLYQN